MKLKYGRYRRRKRYVKKAITRTTQIKRVIGNMAEKKFNDVTLSNQNSIATVGVQALINIAQGNTDITRVGDQIILRSVMFNFKVSQPIATAAGIQDNHTVRIMIIQWKGATVPTPADIFQFPISAFNYISAYDNDRRRKLLTVLYDRTFYIGDAGPQNAGCMNQFMKGFSKKVTFAVGSAIPQDNQLYFINVSDYAAAVGEIAPVYSFYARVKFYDI